MRVFVKLPPCSEQEYGQELSDSIDEDFENESDSVHNRFNQVELNDLSWHLGLSKKASELPIQANVAWKQLYYVTICVFVKDRQHPQKLYQTVLILKVFG